MEVIERNSRTQAKIIDDLLDMSRIVAGKIKLDIQPVDIARDSHGSRNGAARRRRQGNRSGGRFAGTAGRPGRGPQPLAAGDSNLLSNPIKFTPKGGTIRVAATRLDSQFEISVRDSGIGIEPDFLEHVFDRFSQADVGSTRRYGGLGLALDRQATGGIARRHRESDQRRRRPRGHVRDSSPRPVFARRRNRRAFWTQSWPGLRPAHESRGRARHSWLTTNWTHGG